MTETVSRSSSVMGAILFGVGAGASSPPSVPVVAGTSITVDSSRSVPSVAVGESLGSVIRVIGARSLAVEIAVPFSGNVALKVGKATPGAVIVRVVVVVTVMVGLHFQDLL
jgi:hypothetical protein